MNSDSQLLAGKVAIVTGAGQGLGEAISRLLAKRGAAVMLTDMKKDTGEAVAGEIQSSGGKAKFMYHDVSQESEWLDVVKQTVKEFGRLDILVNNAGLLKLVMFQDMAADDFDSVFAVNVRGVFLGCKAVFSTMKAQGGGSIINLSSIAGMVSQLPNQVAYCSSKGAVRLMTKSAASDYADHNIRVNSVHPGVIATPLVAPYLQEPETRQKVLGRTPMKRPGKPEEVAYAVAFLASDESSFMAGSEVVVDGGFLAA